jgi:dephospho-CoA kinase
MLQIGVTGGIGAGKSLVCRIFQVLGAPIYDADTRAKLLMVRDAVLMEQVKEAFGKDAYDIDGRLNRRYLAKQVFSDAEKVQRLNQLVHPRVAEDARIWAEERQHYPYVIREAALLFESGANARVDAVLTVTAPANLRIERVLARDPQRSREEILQIIEKQMSEEEKIAKSDYVLHNDGQHLILPQILQLHQQFMEGKL